MAIDKAVDSAVLDAGLKAIADAIREKAGTEDALAFPEGLVEAIEGIEAGGQYITGTITLAEDAQQFYIPKDVVTSVDGMLPNFFVVWCTTNNLLKTITGVRYLGAVTGRFSDRSYEYDELIGRYKDAPGTFCEFGVASGTVNNPETDRPSISLSSKGIPISFYYGQALNLNLAGLTYEYMLVWEE